MSGVAPLTQLLNEDRYLVFPLKWIAYFSGVEGEVLSISENNLLSKNALPLKS